MKKRADQFESGGVALVGGKEFGNEKRKKWEEEVK